MVNHKKSFKSKVLIPILAVFIFCAMGYSFNSYRLLDAAVKSKTDANLDIFTDSIIAQMGHLEIILDETKRTLNEKHISAAITVADILDNMIGELTTEGLVRIADQLDMIELNVANSDGIVTHSNIPDLIGFDYKAFEITRVYMGLTDGTLTEISEEPRRSIMDIDEYGDINHYTGIPWKDGGFIQLGFNANVIGRLQDEINIERTIRETKIAESGFGLVLSSGMITACPWDDLLGRDVSGDSWYQTISVGSGFMWMEIDGATYYAGFKNRDNVTVAGLVPEEEFSRERNRLLSETILFLILSVAVIFAIVYFVLGKLLNPVKDMVEGIRKIAGGNLDAKMEERYNCEFDQITDAVNSMAADLKTYMNDKICAERQAYELERELIQSRISLMVSQIQPHFIYNSLAAIQDMCETSPERVETAIQDFAVYLRGNLDSLETKHPVLFEKELEHLRIYLSLEKMRFEERLQIEYDIQAGGFFLPALTLQPIVENAVRHGVTMRIKGGKITIRSEEIPEGWRITVEDDGVGFDPDKSLPADGRTHIGIINVKRRLHAMCGGMLEIKSTPGVGTTAVIAIPDGPYGGKEVAGTSLKA